MRYFGLGGPIAPALEKQIREALATPAPASAGLVAAMQAGGCLGPKTRRGLQAARDPIAGPVLAASLFQAQLGGCLYWR
jgi:hypothetical protein